MSKHRYAGQHPICADRPAGLRQAAALVQQLIERVDRGVSWTPAQFIGVLRDNFDFFMLADELKKAGFDADFGARQIVDDCWRAGMNLQFQQHLVEWLLQIAYQVLDATDSAVRR